MKKWQAKIIDVGSDIEDVLNIHGEAGWHFATAFLSSLGNVKFILQRQLDEDVDGKVFTDELAKKFGV